MSKSLFPSVTTTSQFGQGILACIPTLLGYIGIGLAFGMVGGSSGFTILEIALLSIFVYAGSAQFIICALFMASTPISIIIFTTFIVNFRHFLMGLTIAPAFRTYSMAQNIGIGTLLTDETFGVATTEMSRHPKLNASWMHALNITAYLFWILSSVAGAILAKWIDDPYPLGLDFALSAMFIVLLVLQLQQVLPRKLKHMLLVILYTVFFMFVLSFFVPSYLAVLLATMIAATIGVMTDS